ncbi:hypothetical protein FHS85_001954 [Rhodoligotrophos appendicifer]|uniref:spike base protein, RCAP_Rcc01079 family n=1 Tax=Rhodoligotrophos appendicifer TaxID=987056 RepID=UPI001184986A|nr:hypothetical protein [Rhodoligotrophos appendicifer]
MTQTDPFADLARGYDSFVDRHFLIVPSNDLDLEIKPRAIYCHVPGTVVVRDEHGTDLPYEMNWSGGLICVRAVRVLATGTTGTYYGWV